MLYHFMRLCSLYGNTKYIYKYTLQSSAYEFTNNTLDFVKTSDIRFITIILGVFMRQLSKEMHVCLFYLEMKQANM